MLGDRRDLEQARAALAALLEGYGASPAGISWYLATAILGRASRPFRRLDDRWPERVEAIVEAAEAVHSR
jgi:hypothetical protein